MDITLCKGGDCPLKEKCFRYTAKSNSEYQSYFVEPPYDKGNKKCDYYERN
jgi:hypothetical protein